MKKLLFIFGTRPEAIKMAPIVLEALRQSWCETRVCVTGQHRKMLDQVMQFFGLQADYDLSLMKPNQTLFDITADGMKGLEKVLNEYKPDLVLVQGDTTTAFIGALAAFYLKIPVAHVEAGLRSHNRYSPFPEEMNRKMVGSLAGFHFAPTPAAAANLASENIKEQVYITGNPVIDALLIAKEKTGEDEKYKAFFHFIDPSKKLILVTGHRRESFGEPFEQICQALKTIAERHTDCEIVYPVHLNPNVMEPVNRILGGQQRIHLIEPLDYPFLVWLMSRSYLVLTDSGGIQEEAPSLGKPVLVMREVTERTEGIEAGTAILVGTNPEAIISNTSTLLADAARYNAIANAVNPYGDGTASQQILSIINKEL